MTYEVFMIDPPWPKNKGGARAVRPKQGRTLDYRTMPVTAIFEQLDNEVFPLSSEQHVVFMWVVDQFLHEAEKEMAARAYRLHARLIWNKMNGVAPAFSVRYAHEYLLWFYKPKFTPVSKGTRGKFCTVFEEKGREHSRKPEAAYKMIDEWFPSSAPKLDVYSRESRHGWDSFGDQTGHFDQQGGAK